MGSWTDNFNRADDPGSLGANWTSAGGCFQITSNQAEHFTTGRNLYTAGTPSGNDQYAQLKSVSIPASIYAGGPAVRVAYPLQQSYMAWLRNGNGVDIFKYFDSIFTNLGNTTMSLSGGEVIRIEVSGTSVRALVDGVEKISPATDSSIDSGGVGLHGFGDSDVFYDDWEGGDLGGPKIGPFPVFFQV